MQQNEMQLSCVLCFFVCYNCEHTQIRHYVRCCRWNMLGFSGLYLALISCQHLVSFQVGQCWLQNV